MDRFESMQILVNVVEAGSFSAASRKLGVPLATVSRKVSDLETHLKTRLLVRSTRQLALTDAGRAYVASVKRILEDLNATERTAAGEYTAPRGELVITAPLAFGRLHVLPVVAEFLKAYPEIDIRLILTDRLVHLLEDQVDLAVRIGTLPDSSLVAVRVGETQPMMFASRAYLGARGTPKCTNDLRNHDCIMFDGLGMTNAWSVRNGKSETAIPIMPRLTVTTAEAAIDAAIAGVGIARVLCYQAKSPQYADQLVTVLDQCAPPPMPINLVHAGQGLLPLKLRAFIDFAAPRLKQRLV